MRPQHRDVKNYIPELDGLKCLAVVVVLIWHASLRAARHLNISGQVSSDAHDLYAYFPHGEIGVLLFFFLSGFAVSRPFVLQSKILSVKDFYLRRFIRIYPPYFVALTACFFILAILRHVPAGAQAFNEENVSLNKSYVASLLYLHNLVFGAPSRLNPPMWSLEVEVIFYAMLPFFIRAYLLMADRRIRLLSIAALVTLLTVGAGVVLDAHDPRGRWAFLAHIHVFLAGVAIAEFVVWLERSTMQKHVLYDAAFVLGGVLICLMGIVLTRFDGHGIGKLDNILIQISCLASVMLLFFGALYGPFASWILRRRLIAMTGAMCYSIYLTHIVTMQAASEVLGRFHLLMFDSVGAVYATFIPILIVLSVAVGAVFFVMFERPFMKMKSFSRKSPAPRASPADLAARGYARVGQTDPA